jgi:hypothetical protein
MAAKAKYPTVHAQLGALMVEQRREGVPFELFWALAIRPGVPPVTWRTPKEKRPPRCVIWPNDTELRRADREVYADAVIKAGWRRAYERAPEERRDRALVLLASVLTEGEGREPVAA